ncbi:MAG TPA: hypothetical protein VH591_22005 [Ktedonobacterales bacterium]|jgi:hypothetical protein
MPPAAAQALARRLNVMFAPAYLTLISIIQGVALSTLAGRIESGSTHFTPVDWIVASTTFLFCLGVWNEYVMGLMIYAAVASLLDAAIPFAVLAIELLLVHFVGGDPRGYLLAFALGACGGVVAAVHVALRPETRTANRPIHEALTPVRQTRFNFSIVSSILLLGAALAYDHVGLRQAPMLVAVLVLVNVLVFVLSGVPYWQRVVMLAQLAPTVPEPAMKRSELTKQAKKRLGPGKYTQRLR